MIGNAVLALTQSCFLLYQIGAGEVRRNPSKSCSIRVSPQSTFKIPHDLPPLVAVEQAERGLIDTRVLR